MRKLRIVTLSLLAIASGCVVQTTMAGEDARVENVTFKLESNVVHIYYDLRGPVDEEYEVTFYVTRSSDTGSRYQPEYVSGDVGEGRFVGKNRHILWEVTKEEPVYPVGQDLQVIVEAKIASGWGALTWVGVGAAVFGGGIAAYFLLSETEEGDATGGMFPIPPGRP